MAAHIESECVTARQGQDVLSRACSSRVLMTSIAWVMAFVSFAAFATSIQSQSRFTLTGTGTITPDAPVQKNDDLHLKAYLTPNDPAQTQQGGGFKLRANIVASETVCYYDTIFRDDFDGDGG